ncbi:hypothetical protein HS088_TW09G00257 [Tripterygium wilfordii]|uniref:Uncharacterized protein n=1 Tax=Tripterygium wilfordii TaxID=458696 RepID=A0A7J7D7C1_TRIWF|nr:uncharacterized protein LOC120005017 [Tripterygium wilfordii]KAF5742214.1 hypothetical protein HS088_TW09G00257 [Tripterygium wilfordii]
MAYQYSSYYDANPGEYRLIPSDTDYNSAPVQASVTYPGYGYSAHQFHGYDPSLYYDSYNSGSTSYYRAYDHYHPSQSVVSYSAYTPSEPKYIEYQLSQYDAHYSSSTQFVVSYSVSELNKVDDVYEEYDPTPYGGGYDQASTYGKPLHASHEICYPVSSMADPNVLPSPPAEEKVENFPSESKPTPTSAPVPEQQRPIDSHREEVEEQVIDSNYGSGDHGYDYFKPVNQVPSGYGLEAMDICESLFGYWPCLARAKRNGESPQVCDEVSNVSQWKGTADYLFGGSYPYSDSRDMGASSGSGYPIIGYERHQVRYDEDSWLYKY